MKVIIIGAGEVGFNVASRFALENKDVMVIDTDAEAIRKVSDHIDVQVLQGSGSSPMLLEEAGIKEADILLAVTNSDEVNLVACLAADIISPATKKLARLRSADYDPYHEVLREKAPHIDTIINPDIEVVNTIDRLMSVPGAADVGEFADGRVKVVGVYMGAGTPLAGIKLCDFDKVTTTVRPLVAAVIRDENLIIPGGGDILQPGDLVYFISAQETLFDTLKLFGKHAEKVQRVLIVGGGRIGYRLATHLEAQDIYVKIIEKDPRRCLFLSEHLNKAIVLNGDGSDQQLLQEENIQDMDAVATLTSDEETNILVSLLSKQMGARKAITRISKFSYFPLMKTIGIERVVSPRLSAINTILQHIRKGKVLSAVAIKGEQAEVLEAVALETSDIVGVPLKNLSFPKDALVISIIRKEEVLIPTGDSVIMPEDRIVIFATRQAVPKIEKILSVKLEYF